MTEAPRPAGAALYDTIGVGYRELRRPDARLAAAIRAGLRGARSVLNVGAGAGSYEPHGLARAARGGVLGSGPHGVLAVELSAEMIAQRGALAAPVVQASATALPIATGRFDAALAILTVHHWPDRG
ncbi:MAG: class I SAM-dependent methyltransferase, partial [Planctomycetota bacterium]|nr:class I SAM-dependent methyltransferase [Planctomycetota bacterium]